MTWLWPIHTGVSFFDIWSIAHFAFWIFVGSMLWSFQPRQLTTPVLVRINMVLKGFQLVGCLTIAYGWEVFERFAEEHWPQFWLNPEVWYNSWISDPLTCVLGILFMWYALDHWR